MTALLLLALLLCAGAGVCALTRCRMEEGLALAVLGLIAAGYPLALAGGTALLGVLPWLAAAAGAGAAVWRYGVRRTADWRELCQGAALFVLFGALYWWLCRGHWLTDWDDFSHWGRAAKWMFTTDTLYTLPDSGDGFKSYPPATALWQVMLTKAAGCGFREDVVLYANALLTAALLMVPFRAVRAGKRPLGVGVLALLTALCPLGVYPQYFARAGVDGLLGVFCGGILLAGFLPGRSAASPRVEVLACFVLALVKDSGAGLAALAALALLPVRAGTRRALPGGTRTKAALYGLTPLLAVGVARLSWSAHLAAVGAARRWTAGDPLHNLWSILIGNIPPYRAEVLRQFADVMFTRDNYGGAGSLPFLALPLVFALGMALLWGTTRNSRPGPGGLGLAALGVTAVFTLSLLYSYLFVFDPVEAIYLASVYRYLDSCALMLAVVGLLAAGVRLCRAAPGWQGAVLPLCLGWAVLFPVEYPLQAVRNAPVLAAESGQDRYLSRRAAERIRALGEQSPRLWLITANDGGAAAGRIQYDLLPVQIPDVATILMADVPDSVLWAREVSPQDWSRELAEDFDYVYIYCPEDQFVRDYLCVFEPDSQSQVVVDRMFAVIPQGDGTALLRCLD